MLRQVTDGMAAVLTVVQHVKSGLLEAEKVARADTEVASKLARLCASWHQSVRSATKAQRRRFGDHSRHDQVDEQRVDSPHVTTGLCDPLREYTDVTVMMGEEALYDILRRDMGIERLTSTTA